MKNPKKDDTTPRFVPIVIYATLIGLLSDTIGIVKNVLSLVVG